MDKYSWKKKTYGHSQWLCVIGLCHPGSDYIAMMSGQYLPTLSTTGQHEHWVFDRILDLKCTVFVLYCNDFHYTRWNANVNIYIRKILVGSKICSLWLLSWQIHQSDLWLTLAKSAVISAPLLSVSVICAFSWLDLFAQSANTHCFQTCRTSFQALPRAPVS